MSQTKKRIIDISKMTVSELQSLANMSDTEVRRSSIMSKCLLLDDDANLQKDVTSMTPFEEFAAAICFAFGVPGCVLTVPFLILTGTILLGFKISIMAALVVLIPLTFLPVPFIEKSLTSWLAIQIVRYFSFKVVFSEQIKKNRPTILVAPPHGVFPFGNIVTMIGFPSVMGFSFKGLAANAVLRTPIFRQFMATIGVIDASPSSARKALEKGHTIGISTGGVAEVFETNSPTGEEIVILKSRKGIIKLAYRTGADIVPCYLFGNTKLYSMWTGGSEWWHQRLAFLSRRIGIALIVFWGRFGLPVPYRIPILGVMGKPIPVPEIKEEPTQKEIDDLHEVLLTKIVELFDEHKHCYGWGHKKLVII